jgi:hypothetical protein
MGLLFFGAQVYQFVEWSRACSLSEAVSRPKAGAPDTDAEGKGNLRVTFLLNLFDDSRRQIPEGK